MTQTPGVPCPRCGAVIEISLDALLRSRSFKCAGPGCGAVLRLDARRSADALQAAGKLKDGLDQARRMKPDGAR